MKKYREKIMQVVFLIAACISIVAVALICIFLFANGFPAIVEIGPLKFLGGMTLERIWCFISLLIFHSLNLGISRSRSLLQGKSWNGPQHL